MRRRISAATASAATGLAALMLSGAAVVAPTDAAAEAPEPLRGFGRYTERAMRQWQTPGLAVAVVKDGRAVLTEGYGLRRNGRKARVTADTVFAAASITKGFTATAIAMLAEQDKLRWDDRVIDHLPWFRLRDPYVTREIRIRDLLSHRSGVARGEMLWYYSGLSRRDVLQRLRHLDQISGFRSKFGYQNLMFVAAGEVAAAVSGESWDDFVRRKIFIPLGMTASSTSIRNLKGDVATPHAATDGEYKPIDWLNVDNIGPAGSINASVRDMAKWMRPLLAQGRADARLLIGPGQIAEMRTPHTPLPVAAEWRKIMPEVQFRAYGLGWYMEDYRGESLFYHGGRIDGMSSHLALVPRIGLGVAVLSNRGRSQLPRALAYRAVDAYLGPPARDWSAFFHEQDSRRREKKTEAIATARRMQAGGTRPSAPLARYMGRYASPLYGPVAVRQGPKGLTLVRNAQAVADLEHWHFDTFQARFRNPALRDRLVTFRRDENGLIDSLQAAEIGAFQAVEAPIPPAVRGAGKPGRQDRTGIWTGAWNDVLPHALIIQEISGDNAKAIYAWGLADQWGVRKRGWKHLDGVITGDTLTLSPDPQTEATYRFRRDGTLDAVQVRGNQVRRATLRRRK